MRIKEKHKDEVGSLPGRLSDPQLGSVRVYGDGAIETKVTSTTRSNKRQEDGRIWIRVGGLLQGGRVLTFYLSGT